LLRRFHAQAHAPGGLAALSGFDAMDRGPEGMVAAAEMDVAEAKVTGEPAPPEEKD
jgi:hypothetical protein